MTWKKRCRLPKVRTRPRKINRFLAGLYLCWIVIQLCSQQFMSPTKTSVGDMGGWHGWETWVGDIEGWCRWVTCLNFLCHFTSLYMGGGGGGVRAMAFVTRHLSSPYGDEIGLIQQWRNASAKVSYLVEFRLFFKNCFEGEIMLRSSWILSQRRRPTTGFVWVFLSSTYNVYFRI